MNSNQINYDKVLIENEFIDIPVAIFNKRKRKTILITAGIDGDEYTGIKTAYKIINDFKYLDSDYKVIIIPLLNVFGYKAGVSFNPLDQKYPKNIYPGKANGSSSEQLIYHLEKYIKKCFIWIDLHSGSKDEILNPFIWTWETKNKKVNNILISILSNFSNDTIIYQKKSIKKVENLAKKNVAYIMLESGELGKEDSKYIAKHLEWIKILLKKKRNKKNIVIYRKVKFGKARNSGKWQQHISPGEITKSNWTGIIDGKKIYSTEGLILYIKRNMDVKKGEELFATAYDEELL